MTDSSPVLPNSNSSNSSSSASSKKMTKSYLLESDPILKTSSKATSSPFALSNNNNNNAEGTGGNAGNGGSGGGGHRHHHHHHQQQRSSTNWNHYQEDAAAAAAASAAIQQQLRHQHLQLQQHSIPGHDLFSDRPSVKPSLAAHHVQPIAYINGNSVRPVRCRHYSQQQTALSVVHQQQRQEQQQQQAMQHSNGRNLNAKRGGRGIDSMSESTSSTNSTSSISGSSTTGSIDSDGAINHEELMIMDFDGLSNSSGGGGGGNGSGNEAGPAHPPVGHYGAGNAINSGGGNQRRVQFADGGRKMHSSSSSTTTNFSSGAVSSSSYSTASHSNTHSSSSSQQQQRNQSSSSSAGANQQPRSKSSWFSLFTSFSFSSPSSTSSPSSASASASSASSSSQRDSVTIDENELNVNALCNADQPELVIDHLAKVIEAQLRDARENRRLVCKELFLPNDLLRNIAAKVRLLAEPEPCGLRGCKFYICIEDKDASALNSGNTPPATTQSVVSGGGGGHPYHRSNSQSPSPVNSRLLGEVSLDRTMVPTFEVFLTLKPTLPNWFDVLESRLFGRERIIVAENYLIHKKKLYRSHDESPTSDM